jgi:membrane associated rhomboid family serine protease
MSEPGHPGDIALRLPRPGRALKLVLGLVIGFAILGAVMGDVVNTWLAFYPGDFTSFFKDAKHIPHVWAVVTSGVLTPPDVIHLVFVLLGLYFLTPELERRWGGPRLLRFLAIAIALGNAAVLAGSFLPIARPTFHPTFAIGPLAAIAAITVAWAKDNWTATSRFMGILPMSGRVLFYLAIAASVAAVFSSDMSEGVFAPLGGVVAGVLFAGNPSPARTAWLKFRLGRMRRQAGGTGITVSDLLGDTESPRSSRPASKRSNPKGPALRIVQGGLDDELKNRKLPKDKRYLN